MVVKNLGNPRIHCLCKDPGNEDTFYIPEFYRTCKIPIDEKENLKKYDSKIVRSYILGENGVPDPSKAFIRKHSGQ